MRTIPLTLTPRALALAATISVLFTIALLQAPRASAGGGQAGAAPPTEGSTAPTTRPRRQGSVQPQPAQEGATMTNESLVALPPPLPENWPVGAKDAQFRGAACDEGYGKEGARKKAEPGDDVLPLVGRTIPNLPAPYLAVRRLPFLTRRDVVTALYSPTASGTYEVTLKLSADGARKAQEYTKEHENACIALVAGGKVIWKPTLTSPVSDDTFVLSGSFTVSEARAIADLFNQ